MNLSSEYSLKDRMNNDAMTQEEAAQLIYEMVIGLEPSHQSNRAYGNLTPSSIGIDENGGAVLGDWQSVSADDSPATHYMSPALKYHPIPYPQCDIYSLGVIFYELLTGSLPPKPYLPPSRLKPVLPEIDNFLSKVMHLHPDFQYETTREVTQALKKITEKLTPQKALTPAPFKLAAGAKSHEEARPAPVKKKKSFLSSLFSTS